MYIWQMVHAFHWDFLVDRTKGRNKFAEVHRRNMFSTATQPNTYMNTQRTEKKWVNWDHATNLKPQGLNANKLAPLLKVASATNEIHKYIYIYVHIFIYIHLHIPKCACAYNTCTAETNYFKWFAQISDLFIQCISNLFICLFVQHAPTTMSVKVISWHSLLMAKVTSKKKQLMRVKALFWCYWRYYCEYWMNPNIHLSICV